MIDRAVAATHDDNRRSIFESSDRLEHVLLIRLGLIGGEARIQDFETIRVQPIDGLFDSLSTLARSGVDEHQHLIHGLIHDLDPSLGAMRREITGLYFAPGM